MKKRLFLIDCLIAITVSVVCFRVFAPFIVPVPSVILTSFPACHQECMEQQGNSVYTEKLQYCTDRQGELCQLLHSLCTTMVGYNDGANTAGKDFFFSGFTDHLSCMKRYQSSNVHDIYNDIVLSAVTGRYLTQGGGIVGPGKGGLLCTPGGTCTNGDWVLTY